MKGKCPELPQWSCLFMLLACTCAVPSWQSLSKALLWKPSTSVINRKKTKWAFIPQTSSPSLLTCSSCAAHLGSLEEKYLENSFTERWGEEAILQSLGKPCCQSTPHSASHKITSDLIKQTNCLKFKMLSFSPLSGNFPSFKVNRVKSWLRKSWHNHSHLKSQIFVKVGSGLRVLVICLLKVQCLSPNYVQVNPCLEIIQSFKIEGFAPWLPTH